MKIESEPRDDHQIKLTVEVEPDVFEDAKRKAARKLSRRVKIPGFRPGKAPYQVVLRQFGESAIIEDAIENLVEDIYPKVIEEAEIKPYGPGSLENIASMDPPVLEFVVPLDAEVTLGDYHSITKAYEPDEVSEKDIDDVIKDLRERQAILEPVERPVEEGDVVTISISGERTQVEDDQSPTLVQEQELPILVLSEEEDKDQEWPYPGFSRDLIGMNIGDEKTSLHTFSDESEFEELRGVEAKYSFNVSEIKKRILPEVDDEFASTVGEFENLDALREAIRESLEMQAKDNYNESYDEEILQEAVDQAEFKYPPQMLEDEINQVVRNLENRLAQQNLDMDLYLMTRKMDMEALREEVRPTAEARLKRSLVLYELAQAENIEVGTDEVQTETIRTLDYLTRSLSKKDAKKLANENSVRNVMNNVMADMLARKAMEQLRSIASGISLEAATDEDQLEEVESSISNEPAIEGASVKETSIAESEAEDTVDQIAAAELQAPPEDEMQIAETEPTEEIQTEEGNRKTETSEPSASQETETEE